MGLLIPNEIATRWLSEHAIITSILMLCCMFLSQPSQVTKTRNQTGSRLLPGRRSKRSCCKNIDISLPFTAYIRQNNPKSTLSWPPFYWTLELHHVIKNRDVFWYSLFRSSRCRCQIETRLGWRTDRKFLRNPNLNEIIIAGGTKWGKSILWHFERVVC
jgi:hypothetical protein